MGANAKAVLDLLNQGRFAQALASFGSSRTSVVREDPLLEVLRGESLERAGKLHEAEKIAASLLRTKGLPARIRSRALSLEGIIALERAEPHRAVKLLTQSRQVALSGKELEEACWAELRLLQASFDAAPLEETAKLVADLRKHVTQLGNPNVTIALHVIVSELESKRGAIESASRHVRIAQSLSGTFENHWLESLCDINKFCIHYLRGELDDAAVAATRALVRSREFGHARAELAAVIDTAHISLRTGELATAERLLRRAWKMCEVSPRCREYVLDGLAQLELARGNVDGCDSLIKRVFGDEFQPLSYPKLWSYPTRTGVLWARGDLEGAVSLLSEGMLTASSIGDHQLIVRLRLLRAEAHALAGNASAAAIDLDAVAASLPDPSLELVAETTRAAGRTLALAGDWTAAGPTLARGIRIFEAIGHLRAARELRDATGFSRAREADLAAQEAPDRPDVTLGRAAALCLQAGRPELLGRELLDLLHRDAGARASALLAATPERETIIELRGWTVEQAHAARVLDPPLPSIDLGTWRGQAYRVVADVADTPTARTALASLRVLVSGSLVAGDARREARERAALWPIEQPDLSSAGVFAAESMVELLRTIRRVAPTNVPILLTGETGTGKEILARLVHEYSARAERPMVPFNCTAVPRELLDSQLFGHRRGAFTGAQEQATGIVRGAAGGTLFLDEIGELTPDLQPKLLRFLESGEIHPLGEPHPMRVDVRIVAATNSELEQMIAEGRFRADLYYRLNVLRLRVPPLRERREEIPLLVEYYLARFGAEFQRSPLSASEETMEYLLLYPWPGNIRQLANELRRMAAVAEQGAVLMPEHLSPEILASRRTRPPSERDLLPTETVLRLDQSLASATEHLERTMIRHALSAAGGHMEQAARILGLSRKGLYLKRQRLGLGPEGASVPADTPAARNA